MSLRDDIRALLPIDPDDNTIVVSFDCGAPDSGIPDWGSPDPLIDALAELVAAAEARGVERGYHRTVDIVAAALAEAQAEPRRAPTERAGRITALGQLLATLEGTTP